MGVHKLSESVSNQSNETLYNIAKNTLIGLLTGFEMSVDLFGHHLDALVLPSLYQVYLNLHPLRLSLKKIPLLPVSF